MKVWDSHLLPLHFTRQREWGSICGTISEVLEVAEIMKRRRIVRYRGKWTGLVILLLCGVGIIELALALLCEFGWYCPTLFGLFRLPFSASTVSNSRTRFS